MSKFAVILNGEWYVTVISYEKASEVVERILIAADEDEDFRRYYGSNPSVYIEEIKEPNEPVIDLMKSLMASVQKEGKRK